MKLTIGQAARRSGCPASTIRYYERIGLLDPPARGANRYRYYDATAFDRLAFVHRARTLGFSIEAVSNLLRLADHPHSPCDGIDQLLAEQIAAVRAKIDDLVGLDARLTALQAACNGGHEVCDCGILGILETLSNEQ